MSYKIRTRNQLVTQTSLFAVSSLIPKEMIFVALYTNAGHGILLLQRNIINSICKY